MELAMKKILIASVFAFAIALSVQAKDIVDTAVGAGSFKTLATALGAAGLVDTLKGKGPYTVLTAVLTNHIVLPYPLTIPKSSCLINFHNVFKVLSFPPFKLIDQTH